MRRTAALAACLALTGCLTGCFALPGGDADEGSGDLPAAVDAADALATEGLEAIDADVPGARWLGPASSLDRCDGAFDVASYSVDGTLQADDPSVDAVAAAWERAGLEVDRGDEPTVSRDGAVMSYAVVPAQVGPDIGRFEVRVDCTSADGDVIDDLESSAPKDLGADLGLPQSD